MLKKILKFFKKKKTYKNYFLKDNLKDEIRKNLCSVGKWSYGNPKIYRWDWSSKLIIGNFCSLGPEIKIYFGGNHRTDWITTSPLPAPQFSYYFNQAKNIQNFCPSGGDINIGHDVWIGGHTIILSGSTIGNGTVIGAGSLVSGNLESYSIYAGNPIKKIRDRFDKSLKEKINETEWWNFDNDLVNDLSKYLCSDDYDGFFKAIKKINL